MFRQIISILTTLAIATGSVQAQLLSDQISATRGVIVNDSTGQSIPFAHLFNESMRLGSISDKNGQFSILAEPGDTLILGALGYFSKIVFVTDTMFRADYQLALTPRSYEIEEVSVLSFRDYEHFKKAFLELELPQTETRILRNNLVALSRKEAREGDSETDMRINQLQPNIRLVKGNVILYSKEDLMRMNYEKVLQKESRQRVIDEKYNKEIIGDVTHLPQEEIIDFMGFCNFTEEYLFNASPYEILVEIEKKLVAYKLKKGGGELNINNTISIEAQLAKNLS